MQKLFIAGGVGKDAQLRTTQSGDQVLSFSLAIDNGKDKNGERRETTWYDASLFGKRAEALAPHIKKGDKLTLIGRPTVRVHEGKAYLGISVDDLTFMGSANKPAQSGGSSDDYREKREPPRRDEIDESDIPF
jgi:single-strand DNA-binding protein